MELKKAKILINKQILKFSNNINNILSKNSFEVYFYTDTSDAIDIINKENISIVLINNFSILKELNNHYKNTSLTYIVATNDTSMLDYYIQEGASEFINLAVLEEDIVTRLKLVIKKEQRIKSLIDLTNKDFLTNLANKKYFYEQAVKSYKENDNLAICMIDIDDFKMINDTYGHLVGDIAIKELAKILEKNTKGKDIVARFGGDEFCILLQDITPLDASELINNIRSQVTNTTFSLADIKLNFTISTGLSTNKGSSLEEMIHYADKDLFNSKKLQKPKRKLCTNCNLCKKDKKATSDT